MEAVESSLWEGCKCALFVLLGWLRQLMPMTTPQLVLYIAFMPHWRLLVALASLACSRLAQEET